MTKDGCRNESINQLLKGLLLGRLLFLVSDIVGFPTFLKAMKKVIKRSGNTREVIDKASIEVVKPEKNLNIVIGLKAWPFGNSLDTGRVYTNSFFINDKA